MGSRCRLAASRNVIIPVFAEMGSLNPLVVTPAAAAARTEEIARGFVDLTLGMGQYCTKPGLLLVPSGHGLVAAVTSAFEAAAPAGWLLTQPIATSYAVGVGRLLEGGGRLLAAIPAVEGGWAASPTLVAATPDQIVYDVAFREEYFGPVAVVCEYGSEQELERVLAALPGSLVAAVHGELADDPLLAALTRRLAHLAGRVVVNGYPTGVVVGWRSNTAARGRRQPRQRRHLWVPAPWPGSSDRLPIRTHRQTCYPRPFATTTRGACRSASTARSAVPAPEPGARSDRKSTERSPRRGLQPRAGRSARHDDARRPGGDRREVEQRAGGDDT